MSNSETVPLSRIPRITLRTLAVEVLDGADAGLRTDAESDRLTIGTALGNDLVLKDEAVSGFHLELLRCTGGIQLTDLESTNGTWLGSVRVSRACAPPGTELLIGRTRIRISDGVDTAVEVCVEDELSGVYGAAPTMRRLMAQVDRVARTSVAVLLTGESGTGKELVSLAIHARSPRNKRPIVTVDCGSLAPNLVASELFGHERGAFTGADRQHIGAFERADGGTLFLDEIGELPAELQPQLLGALERQRFRRVGGKTDISVSVRVVSATNRDLRTEVNSGRFRLDLYYRLAVVELRIPALRDRADDIPLLIAHFLKEAGEDAVISSVVSEATLQDLTRYRWPGNVRELRNWVEATVAMGESPRLIPKEEPDASSEVSLAAMELPYKSARNAVLTAFERAYLSNVMSRSAGNVSLASRLASMDRTYLLKLLQRHDLK